MSRYLKLLVHNPVSHLLITGLIGWSVGQIGIAFALYVIGALAVMLYQTEGLRALYYDMGRVFRAHPIRLPVNAVLILTLVLVLHSAIAAFVPVLNTGWTYYAVGENTNIITKPLVVEAAAANWTYYAQAGIAIVGWLLVMVALPFLAYIEERIFRHTVTDEGQMWLYSTAFGLLHLLPGAPLSACMALIVAGYCFAYLYRYRYRRALEQFEDRNFPEDVNKQEWSYHQALTFTTAQHYCYNMVLLIILGFSTYM